MIVRCRHDELMEVSKLLKRQHPENPNDHPSSQITRLAEIMKYQGVRHPIVISNLSGLITKGHGRLMAAVENKWTDFPVEFQDYENEDQEYADVVADNAIASWAELNLSAINAKIPELGPMDINMLGLKQFTIDPTDKSNFDPNAEWKGMPEFLSENLGAWKTIYVHFENIDSLNEFSRLISQNLTESTKSIWHPKKEAQILEDKIFASES